MTYSLRICSLLGRIIMFYCLSMCLNSERKEQFADVRGGWGESGPLSLLFKYLLTVKCVEANDWLLLQTTEVVMSGIKIFPEKCIRRLSSKTFVNDFEKPLLPRRWGKSGMDGHSCPAIKISHVSNGN